MTSSGSNGYYPAVCKSLPIQYVEAGIFCAEEIEWTEIVFHGSPRLAAKIPSGRLPDFIAGEQDRGCCQINCRQRKGSKKALETDNHYECYGGKLRKDQLEKQALGCTAVQTLSQGPVLGTSTAPTESSTTGTKKRRSRVANGQSVKEGCVYTLRAKTYIAQPDEVILLFDSKAQMQHKNSAGQPVHVETASGKSISDGTRLWVLNRLLLQVPIKNILADNCLRLKDKHRKEHFTDEECVAAVVASSDSRDLYLTRHDITNIRAKCIDAATWKKHDRDVESVAIAYREDQKLPLGKQTYLCADFTLDNVRVIVSTPAMIDSAVELGHDRPVFMDATHGVIKYGFKLVTLLVLDQHGKGLPIAWGFLEHERTEDYTKFLQVVDAACNRRAAELNNQTWRPSCILTDDAAAEHAAARSTWQGIEVFLCIWHVLKAWTTQLRTKLGKNKGNTYKLMYAAMHAMMVMPAASTPSETKAKLNSMAKAFAETFADEPAAVAYFESTWLHKIGMWALGLRASTNHLGANTTGLCEGYHSFIKDVFACLVRHARRLDHMLYILLHKITEYYGARAQYVQFGLVWNVKAEQKVQKAMMAAADIPPARFVFQRAPDASIPSGEYIQVTVLNKDLTDPAYTLLQPQEHHACCTCPAAVQGDACKHQLRALSLLYPHPRTAHLLLSMLGTRFGCPGGCTFKSVSPLGCALVALEPDTTELSAEQLELIEDAQCAGADVVDCEFEHPGSPVLHDTIEHTASVPDASPAPPSPRDSLERLSDVGPSHLLDPDARARHVQRTQQDAIKQLEVMFNLVQDMHLSPDLQFRAERVLSSTMQAGINTLLSLQQDNATSDSLPDFQQGNSHFSLVRMKSCLETGRKRQKRPRIDTDKGSCSTINATTSVPLSDFRNAQPQREKGYANAWKTPGLRNSTQVVGLIGDMMDRNIVEPAADKLPPLDGVQHTSSDNLPKTSSPSTSREGLDLVPPTAPALTHTQRHTALTTTSTTPGLTVLASPSQRAAFMADVQSELLIHSRLASLVSSPTPMPAVQMQQTTSHTSHDTGNTACPQVQPAHIMQTQQDSTPTTAARQRIYQNFIQSANAYHVSRGS